MGSTTYPTMNYSYDSLDRLTEISHDVNADTVSTKYSYLAGTDSNTTGLVSSVKYRYANYAFGPAYDIAYTYDNKGNILSETYTQNGVNYGNISYKYDYLDRLTRENNSILNKTVVYTYDEGGNILNKKQYAYTTGTLGTVQSTVNYTYDTAWKDKLTNYNGSAITYDSIGNPLSYRGMTFTWQRGRQLSTVNNGSSTYTYNYDINGNRIRKTGGGKTVNYDYVGNMLVQMTDGTNTLKFTYDANGVARSVKLNNTCYYYLYNLQGDVTTIYDDGGNLVVKYTYDAWGKQSTVTGSLASTLGALNPIRYRGYIYDNETGFYYCHSRYYDPETCRFINADAEDVIVTSPDALTDKNLFAYCDNNPVIRKDDDGEFWNTAIGIISGALVGGISAAITGTSVKAGIVSGIISGGIAGAALDLTIATGGAGVVALALVSAASGTGSAVASYVNQKMNGASKVDIGAIVIDGIWGCVAGAVSFGLGDVGGSTCKTLKQTISQPAKKIVKQFKADFSMATTVSATTWFNSTKLNSLRNKKNTGVDRRARAARTYRLRKARR